jgi:hypothetical protein
MDDNEACTKLIDGHYKVRQPSVPLMATPQDFSQAQHLIFKV